MNQKNLVTPTIRPIKKLKFHSNSNFHTELTRRVNNFFETTEFSQRDCPEMYIKTIIICTSFWFVYLCLVFLAKEWWQALPLSILLGLLMVGIGFNIQHDGSHNAYSNSSWLNKLTAMTMDMIGFSSYYWKWGHTIMHHTYTNISHYDSDFDFGLFARKTPFQQWHFCHSYQHYYIWILYGYYTIEWALFHDFSNLFSGKSIERLNSPKIKGTDLVIFMGGKAVFIYFTFGLPLTSHSFWNVLICYLVVAFTVGIVMNVVFLLAHEVQEATFSLPPENTDTIENAWAIHQTETCVNFPCNRFLSWFLGGLNFQIEHHLFPNICHVNYPMIAKIVEETCQEFDVKYKKHDSIWAGITSHFRLLRYLGESKENF